MVTDALRFWRKATGRSLCCCRRSAAARRISTPSPSDSSNAGYRVVRPQPRGIGRSVAPLGGINLHDYAADVAAVIEQEKKGPAFVVGHAFGNRVARMLATDRPELVTAVALVAANIGKAPSTPQVREAIRNSANPALPDDERIKALQFAFFAPGNDPRVWLKGWYPDVLAAERAAGDRTSREEDFAAGQAPILYVQPAHDPLAHVEDAKGLQGAIRRPRHRRGHRAREPRGDRGAAGGGQRRAHRLRPQAVAAIDAIAINETARVFSLAWRSSAAQCAAGPAATR